MKGEVDFLANFPIDTSLKKKTHSAMKISQNTTTPRALPIKDPPESLIFFPS